MKFDLINTNSIQPEMLLLEVLLPFIFTTIFMVVATVAAAEVAAASASEWKLNSDSIEFDFNWIKNKEFWS